MKSRYELFDHTADVGVRVVAATLPLLVRPAIDGLYAVIGELVPADTVTTLRYDASDDEPALLLRDYLAELLGLFETQQQMVVSTNVEHFDATHLVVAGEVANIDPARSALEREVKAVTYHELSVRRRPGGYEATFIVDI